MKSTAINKLNAKIAITVIAVGTLISIAFVKSPSVQNDTIVAKKKVEQPLKGVDVAYTSYKINAGEASVNVYSTGSKINIPAGAFVDSKGKPVTGMVDVKYREFHDPSDFFVSGIPMTYDSAGVQYHFESAGMLEILASQDGVPVFVNPDKKIIVEMASEQQEDKYNIYRFDSLAGNWKFMYKDRAKGTGESTPAIKNEMPVASAIPVTRQLLNAEALPDPVKPQLVNKHNFQFNLNVDLAEFPEIDVYKNVLYEVKDQEADFNKSYASITWSDVSLEKNNSGSYLMTLARGMESHTFIVNPVFDEASYNAAFSTYQSLLTERKNKEALTRKTNDSIYRVLDDERKFQAAYAKDYSLQAAARLETQNVVQRVFVINGFGIWNSDCPACLPRGEEFAATYVDSLTGKKLQFKTLYLVEKGRNAMFAITSYSRLYYDPKKENLLWAVTMDNHLAVFKQSRFKDLKEKNDSCTVSMTVIGEHITTAYQVKKILQF
ncbi:MAG: hypothetical protein JWP12_113 [Bacteroidetes bacterium]|nr:hypothetical protein [Bacteroidota bacterium]